MNDSDHRFWTPCESSGHLHVADQSHPNYIPDVALVFVHGILSGSALWDGFAQDVLDALQIEVPALAYGYESWFHQRGSNQQAAEELGETIERELGTIHHIVFVAHSNGGLVVKELIRQSEDYISENAASRDLDRHWCITTRTRAVLNIGVPHFGSSWRWRPLLWLFYPFVRNSIFRDLARPKRLRQLENDYWSCKKSFQKHLLPFPITIDVRGRRDTETDPGVPAERENNFQNIRGKHRLEKIDKSPFLHTVKKELGWIRGAESLIVAERTHKLIHQVESDEEVRSMLPETNHSEPGFRGTQAQVFSRLLSECTTEVPSSRLFLLTGTSGVGKTRMLAHLARHLHLEYLRGPDTSKQSILIQFDRLNISKEAMERVLHDAEDVQEQIPSLLREIIEAWAAPASKVAGSAGKGITADWLRRQLLQGSFVLILDNVDNLMRQYPQISWEHVRAALTRLEDLVQDGQRIVIVGARFSPAKHKELSQDWRVAEIELMSEEDAIRAFPKMEEVFQMVRAGHRRSPAIEQDLEALRTPLLLRQIGKRADEFVTREGHGTVAHVYDFAIDLNVERVCPAPGGLLERSSPLGPKDRRALKAGLSLVARVIYGGREDELGPPKSRWTIAELQAAVGRIVEAWPRSEDSDEAGPKAQTLLDDFSEAADRIHSDESFVAAMLSTVFSTLDLQEW